MPHRQPEKKKKVVYNSLKVIIRGDDLTDDMAQVHQKYSGSAPQKFMDDVKLMFVHQKLNYAVHAKNRPIKRFRITDYSYKQIDRLPLNESRKC